MKLVLMLTYCQDLDSISTATLTFETLRVGFPSSAVCVFDNGSIPAAYEVIAAKAKRTECSLIRLDERVGHDAWLRRVFTEYPLGGTVVILDPDLIFWQSVEDWEFPPALLAGRLIPGGREPQITGALILPRLHPSFWWVPDIGRLRRRIEEIEAPGRVGTMRTRRVFEQCTFRMGDRRIFSDTGAFLYAEICKEAWAFGPRELDAYDHLFLGSHTAQVFEQLPGLAAQHAVVKSGNYGSLRGVWRAQESFFQGHSFRWLYGAQESFFQGQPAAAKKIMEGE